MSVFRSNKEPEPLIIPIKQLRNKTYNEQFVIAVIVASITSSILSTLITYYILK